LQNGLEIWGKAQREAARRRKSGGPVDYKTELTSYHVPKFRGDRRTERGYIAVKKKKRNNISSKT